MDANLWDVEPFCQIAGIGESDTVLIDGAFAATIHWDSFQLVAVTIEDTWTRFMSRGSLRTAPVYLFICIAGFMSNNPPLKWSFFVLTVIIMLLFPILTLHIYSGKLWSTQPWLFGIESHLPSRRSKP
jgi:hypothetical protein